jgi:hypothetical protein
VYLRVTQFIITHGNANPVDPTMTYGGGGSYNGLIISFDAKWKWVVNSPAALFLAENSWILFNRWLVELRNWSGPFGEENNLLPPLGFDHPARVLITIAATLRRLPTPLDVGKWGLFKFCIWPRACKIHVG